MSRLSRREFVAAGLAAFAPGVGRGQTVGTADPVRVPARAVTGGPHHHFFGYYDKTPWDLTGRYLLAHRVGFAARDPKPGETATVGMVDLQDGDRYIPLDTTAAWSWQQGAMLQWLGSAADREVIYNVVGGDGEPAAVVRDVHSGAVRRLPKPVYGVSADGRQAVCPDFARTHRLRAGYGYAGLTERFAADPAPEKLGVWHLDLATGADRLVLSLAQLAAHKPDERMAGCHHGVEHPTFNPGGSRFVFLHRWTKPGAFNQFLTRVFTARPDGSDLRLHLDTGIASHFDWRDDHTLLFWARTPKDGDRFFTLDVRTDAITPVGVGVLTQDGHCSYSPDRRWVLNDTYPDRDRMQALMLFDPKSNRRYDLNRFRSPPEYAGAWRCDLHPRWDRTGTKVCIDGCHDARRQVYVLDVGDVVGGG